MECLPAASTTVGPSRSAIVRCDSGGIIRSSVVTRYQLGLCRQAACITISVRGDEELCARVSDDGLGGADPSLGSGLLGLADRAGALGGRLGITSVEGGGTTISTAIPP